MAQEDTIYVNMTVPVLAIWEGKIQGSIGTKDYKARPGKSTLELVATKPDTFQSYLIVQQENVSDRVYLLMYKDSIERVIYDYRSMGTFGNTVQSSREAQSEITEHVDDVIVESKPKVIDQDLARKLEFINVDKQQFYDYVDFRTTVTFQLLGIYTDQEKLYFKFQFQNKGVALTYVLDYLQIKFVDNKKVNSGSTEEKKRMDIIDYFPQELPRVEPGDRKQMIVTTAVYSGTGKSHIMISALEEKGRRELSIKVPNKAIFKAKPIGDL